jgi:hypothetical protein
VANAVNHRTETYLHTGNPAIDAIFPRIKSFMLQDITEYNMLGTRIRGYRTPDTPSIWLRDYSDMMRGFKYWEQDVQSVVTHFGEMQSERGWVFDYLTMTPEKVPCERENWAKYVRVPVEADVEYRFVKAVYQAWQATGDRQWLRRMLPHMEKALRYVLTDPWRWDKKTGLVKRALTMDTWDFDYTAGAHPWLNFQVTDRTFWGIMHGDNSGYYEAFNQMGRLSAAVGRHRQAAQWLNLASRFRTRANKACFNGRFYTHHVHLVPVNIPGFDESRQLSLSNPIDINRGLPTHGMAVSILQEYQDRARTTGAFAPWFTIDPPFPDGMFGDEKLVGGAYCNGGIMPLVGGDLARAALEHGFEEFGIRQLLIYEELTRNNESYLWYFPDGRHSTVETSTSPDASPTDGWGSSAMMYALIEGLAGVVDEASLFRQVRLSPRWVAAGCTDADVCTAYGPSGASIQYRYAHDPARGEIMLEIRGRGRVDLHLMLPPGTRCSRLEIGGRKATHRNTRVQKSSYVDAQVGINGKATVKIHY